MPDILVLILYFLIYHSFLLEHQRDYVFFVGPTSEEGATTSTNVGKIKATDGQIPILLHQQELAQPDG